MERRNFIQKFAVGGSILLAAPALFNACAKDETPVDNNPNQNTGGIEVDLTDAAYTALATVGGFAYKGDIIIFRTSDTNYMALSKLCTHSQCTITYNHSSGNLPCPCHGSKFNTTGGVLNGPAAANLKSYSVTKSGNILKIA